MEVASFILSLVAIAVSVVVAINEHLRELRINKTNLSATYFDEIYKKHLIYEIPKARRLIRFGMDNKLADTDAIIGELNEVRKDSLYFCYVDKPFYDDVVQKLQKLEDYIITSEDKVILDEQQTQFFLNIQNLLNELYLCITKHYQGTT